jgi:hypothetical protein
VGDRRGGVGVGWRLILEEREGQNANEDQGERGRRGGWAFTKLTNYVSKFREIQNKTFAKFRLRKFRDHPGGETGRSNTFSNRFIGLDGLAHLWSRAYRK